MQCFSDKVQETMMNGKEKGHCRFEAKLTKYYPATFLLDSRELFQ